MDLRPYQEEAVMAVWKEWEQGRTKTLLILPTGAGKTICFSKVIEEAVKERGNRCLVIAHRDELLDQAKEKIMSASRLPCAKEKANETIFSNTNPVSIGAYNSMGYPVTVGSVQTLQRDSRLARFSTDFYQNIVVDEAHHALATGYQNVLQHFSSANVLGVTATPDRGDKKNIGQYFDSIAYEYTLRQAQKDGYLCRIEAQTIPLQIEMEGLKTTAGDYTASSASEAIEPYLEQIASEMEAYCKDRKTVVFLPLVATSQKFCEILNRHGFDAAEVNGNSPDRAETLKAFDEGKFNVLCNAMLLTEGWDCPSVDCVVILRPTKVRALYSQMVGRGTRLYPGKKNLLLLDFLWQTWKHDLCRPSSLMAKTEEVAKKMTEVINGESDGVDLEEALEQAEKDVQAEREKSLAEQLFAMRTRKRRTLDPVQFAFSISDEDLQCYEPEFTWQMAPASQKQLAFLEKKGFDASAVQNAGHASLLIDKIIKRCNAHLATPKQVRQLEMRNFQKVGLWSFEDASNMMARLAGNRWMIPRGISPSTYVPPSLRGEL